MSTVIRDKTTDSTLVNYCPMLHLDNCFNTSLKCEEQLVLPQNCHNDETSDIKNIN